MIDKANRTRASLLKLAHLLDISTKYGWEKNLANLLDLKDHSIYTWVRRDSIPKKQRQKIAERGYPEADWYIKEEDYSELSGQMPEKYTGHAFTDEECQMLVALRELEPLSREGIYLSIQVEINKLMRDNETRKNKRKMEFLKEAIESIDKLKADV